MTCPLTRIALVVTLTASIHLPAAADVILLGQAIQDSPANGASGVERPTPGMSMSKVTARFGAPLEQREAVGDPPITRWIYDRYTVYFEHDRVINTVVRRPLVSASAKSP